MRVFTGHKIIKDDKGYTLVLYLDYGLTEFAREIGQMDKTGGKSLRCGVQDYIKDNLPQFKFKKINVMLGSLSVASWNL